MIYREGITINGLHSFVDFGLNINSRKIGDPPKNSIYKTIPFMNGAYDFTNLAGGVTWGNREITYTFDIVGETVKEMDDKRTDVLNWLCNLHDVDIFDDTIPDYHFHGSFSSSSQNEDAEKSELTVTFNCYPFKIANDADTMEIIKNSTYTIVNEGQPIKLRASGKGNISLNGKTVSINNNTEQDTGIILTNGDNVVTVAPNEYVVYPFYAQTKTENGITFTANQDKTINISGTATANTFFHILYNLSLEKGTYYMSGLPVGISGQTFRFAVDEMQTWTRIANDFGTGAFMTLNEQKLIQFYIVVERGKVLDNVVVSPTFCRVIDMSFIKEVL